MDLVLYYLIGCLIGFGTIYTFVMPYKKDSDMSNFRIYIYGIFCSWLTVVVFLFGVFVGIMKGVRGDED